MSSVPSGSAAETAMTDERPWGAGERIKNAILAAGNNRTVSVDDAWGALGDLRGLLSRVSALEAALEGYETWASRMPDAGFTEDDPRWAWWEQRPFIAARAALVSSRGVRGPAGDTQ